MTRPRSWMLPMLAASTLVCLTAHAASPLRGWPTTMPQERDANVRAVQYLLISHGFTVASDGFFGRGTEKSLRRFQASRHLVASGRTNNPTWEALIVPLHLGSRGPAVKAAQAELRDAGYAVALDGVFGTGMKDATQKLQSRTGHTADGVIGRNTWYELVGGSVDSRSD